MDGWLPIAAAIVVSLVVPGGLFIWARWLSNQPLAPRGFRALPVVVLLLFGMTAIMTLIPLADVYRALFVERMEEKATLLARGISTAMNCHAFGIVVLAFFSIPLLVLTLWTVSRRRPA